MLLAPFFLFANRAEAAENQFITIVNPVRVSSYNPNPAASLESEYGVIFRNNLPATWLLTFDIISNASYAQVLKNFNNKQELGIFLEVSPKFAQAAGVKYHNAGFWHFANAVFLSGYTQQERLKLIDAVFAEFKQVFGYYPRSVGSWWTDAFSLSYMKEKYEITANLGVADQFSTDGYQVWGQYFSTPFYPSKHHSGIPAPNLSVKLDLVTIQWAPRDPLNGYASSLYSTQDYHTVGLGTDYFEKLINLYAKKQQNDFGQITLGLEGDFPPDTYKGGFAKQMDLVARLQEGGEFKVTNMATFSQWYRQAFPQLSPAHLIVSDDLLGKKTKGVWYQAPRYRVGLVIDEQRGAKIFDFRIYHSDFQEPYFVSPNKEFQLSIYIPSIFDEVQNRDDVWPLPFADVESADATNKNFQINFEDGTKLEFTPEKIVFNKSGFDLPTILSKHPSIKTNTSASGLEILPQEKWIVDEHGFVFSDLTSEATHFLAGKKVRIILVAAGTTILFAFFRLLNSRISLKSKSFIWAAAILVIMGTASTYYQKSTMKYFVPQAEIDTLFRLSVLPFGKVMVYDKECLQCSWQTREKPAVFANKRNYVEKYSKHPIVYNSSVFEVGDRESAREEFSKLDVKYIYVVKFEDYIEKVPFSPGDLGIEKIYSNANSELWRVKK